MKRHAIEFLLGDRAQEISAFRLIVEAVDDHTAAEVATLASDIRTIVRRHLDPDNVRHSRDYPLPDNPQPTIDHPPSTIDPHLGG